MGWERHPSWEVHFVISGSVTYEFKDGTTLEITGGMFLAIPPRLLHRTFDGIATPATRLAIRWRREAGLSLGFSSRETQALFLRLAASACQACVMPQEMVRSVRRLFAAVGAPPETFGTPILQHLCNDLLLNFANAPLLDKRHGDGEAIIGELKRYIQEHCCERLGFADIVRRSGYGATRLVELFYRHAGMSPNDCIVRARIDRAKEMILAGDKSFTEIALNCSFCSSAYFSTTFRHMTGQSPRDWAKTHRTHAP